MTRLEATQKIMKLKGAALTDAQLAEKLGISRPTLSTRLKMHNWKKGEIILIENL